jgi:hypothetical protein
VRLVLLQEPDDACEVLWRQRWVSGAYLRAAP